VVILTENGAGRSNTISISKTKNKTASKKNRREKGNRAVALGSNPHSKGELFSRSFEERIERIIDAEITKKGRIIARRERSRVKNIL